MRVAYFIGGPIDQAKMILQDDQRTYQSLTPYQPIMVGIRFPAPGEPETMTVVTTTYRALGPVARQNGMDVYVYTIPE